MSEEKKGGRNRWDHLKNTYRFVILNNETFKEVGSYKLTLLNVYILFSTLIVIVTVVVVLAIAFTPARRLIPGYASGSDHSEMVKLYHDLDSLQQLTEAQELYNENFRKMLVGEVEYAPKSPPKTKKPADMAPDQQTQLSEEEKSLRSEVEMEDIRGLSEENPSAGTATTSTREIPLEQIYFTPPISGSISAGFDLEKNHFGVDVIAPKNTPVKAVMDGWVIASDWTLETGNTIAIQHTNNIVTFYKHNSALLKKAGSYVRGGEAIAIIGNTGELTDGPHLHFELWHRGKPMNPVDFVNFK